MVPSHLLVRAEDVQSQGLLSLVDEGDGIVHVTHCNYGQHGAEDLLLHQPGVGRHVLQHRWGFQCNINIYQTEHRWICIA